MMGLLAVLGLLALLSGGAGLERQARQVLSGVVSVTPEGRSGPPSLAVGPDGRPVVAWQEWTASGGVSFVVKRYREGAWRVVEELVVR